MKSLNICFPEKLRAEARVEDVPELKPTEVRCRALKSLFSAGTELRCFRGEFDPQTNWASWVQYPFYPGYCMVAEVIETGRAVEGVSVGDRVTATTSHRQVFNADYRRVRKIPDAVSDEQASWRTLATTTQFGSRRAELKLGETVGIIGLGQLGQLVTRYVRVAGAGLIVAIDAMPERLQLAAEGGATHTLAMDATAARAEIARLTDGRMLDVVFDVTGNAAVLAAATPLVRMLGRVVLLGDTTTPSRQHLGPNVVSDSVSILGIHGSRNKEYDGWDEERMSQLFYTLLQQGRMNVDQLISRRVSPQEAPGVYDWLLNERPAAVGVAIDWSQA